MPVEKNTVVKLVCGMVCGGRGGGVWWGRRNSRHKEGEGGDAGAVRSRARIVGDVFPARVCRAYDA